MSRAFFRQLFDAPAEIAIAQGRVVLAAISLVGIWFDPTEPPAFALHVQTTLIFYALYALTILTVLHWRVIHLVGGNIIHAVDIVVVTLLLFLSDGFSSPFLVFFTFVLLAASSALGLARHSGDHGYIDTARGGYRGYRFFPNATEF